MNMPLIRAMMPNIFISASRFDAGDDQRNIEPISKGKINSHFAGFIRRVKKVLNFKGDKAAVAPTDIQKIDMNSRKSFIRPAPKGFIYDSS